MAFKLLAVLAMAGGVAHADAPRLLRDGAPAAGNTMGKRAPEVEVDDVPTPDQTAAVRALGAKLFAMFSTSDEQAVAPRQLHGRPACGNVASRAPRPRKDCP